MLAIALIAATLVTAMARLATDDPAGGIVTDYPDRLRDRLRMRGADIPGSFAASD